MNELIAFKVIFTKQVMGCENEEDDPPFVRLTHTLIIPFVPVEGMWFTDGDWDELATNVAWDAKKEVFHVITPQDDEIEKANMLRKDHRPLMDVIRDYVGQGWDVQGDDEDVEAKGKDAWNA